MGTYPKTRFLTNDEITRKKWSKELFRVVLPEVEYNYLVGTGADAVIQMRTELGKGEGDVVKFDIRLPLSQEGIVGYSTVEGNEERMAFRQFDMTIEELNLAVDTGGRMEQQRMPYNLVSEGKDALKERWGEILSSCAVNCLVGNSSFTVNGQTFAQACTEPTVGKFVAVNQEYGTAVATAEAALTSADIIDLTFLDRMKQLAEVPYSDSDFRLRAPMVRGGKKYWWVIMHNYAFDMLRKNTNIGQWGDLARSAQKLQVPMAEIEYNGMLITKSERIPLMRATGNGGIYRCVLLGAQAATWAWGGAGESKGTVMNFVPYTKDAKRFLMLRGGGIFGFKKVYFDRSGNRDYGVITGSGYAEKIQ